MKSMKSIKSRHNRNLIYRLLVMRMISLTATMIQRVNDLEAFVIPSACL